jgi:hypothetical protein
VSPFIFFYCVKLSLHPYISFPKDMFGWKDIKLGARTHAPKKETMESEPLQHKRSGCKIIYLEKVSQHAWKGINISFINLTPLPKCTGHCEL